jgi:(R,R)-butanediol dehydrogenase/meso-butanediol dehydrogenase/diacetyl reductase
MKAVALQGVGRLELVELPEPEPEPGEVKLRVRYCGVCGTDLHEFRSDSLTKGWGRQSPIMGHEFSATVVSLSPGVEGLAPGDLLTVNPGEPCGQCHPCQRGYDNLCQRIRGIGYQRPGAFADYLCARADRAVKLSPDARADLVALSEPLAVALHALNQGQLQRGESVFIAGAGPIGALCVAAARRMGAGRIIVSEPAANRRALAQRLGADEVIDPLASPAAAQVRASTAGTGVDLSVECVGIGPALDDCLAVIRRAGRCVLTGVFEEPYPVRLQRTTVLEHQLIGTFGYREEFAEAADLIASSAVDVAPLISRTVGLSELPAALAELDADPNRYHKLLVSPDM